MTEPWVEDVFASFADEPLHINSKGNATEAQGKITTPSFLGATMFSPPLNCSVRYFPPLVIVCRI